MTEKSSWGKERVLEGLGNPDCAISTEEGGCRLGTTTSGIA